MDECAENKGVHVDGEAKKKKRRPKNKNANSNSEPSPENDVHEESSLPSAAQDDGANQRGCEQLHADVHDDPNPAAWDPAQETWFDVTNICDLASQGMKLGEMIESRSFRLLDAMSAIEIMDPRMDSGFNSGADMTLGRAAESGILARSIPHEDLLSIWDQLLMYYMLWLEGHTIVQTCFCCLYLQDIQNYVRPVPLFGAFTDAFLAVCRLARDAILSAGVFDDEDFLPSLFGINLERTAFSKEPDEISRRLEEERKKLAGKGTADPSSAEAALSSRLEFIGEYMVALKELTDLTATPALKPRGSAQARLTACLGLLEKMRDSTKPATPFAAQCFDASFNRKLLVPGPPRTVMPLSDPQATIDMWTSHVHELLLCGELTRRPLHHLLGCSIAYKGEPTVLPRSVAQGCVSDERLLRRLILDSLGTCLFPAEAIQHCRKPCEEFLSHCASLFAHLLRLAHANRARRFRRLAHVFTDFDILQHEAWQLDKDLKEVFGANLQHPRPCWIWIMDNALSMMITKLFLGFDLDLYEQGEFHMIYWYVDYLYGLRIYNMNELYHYKESSASDKKKKQQAKNQQPIGGLHGGLKPMKPPTFLLHLQATQAVVRGLFRILAFCARRGLVKTASGHAKEGEGLAQRFVLRFRALEHFRLPHVPSFQNFEETAISVQAPVGSVTVLEAAQGSLAEAGHFLQKAAGTTGVAGAAAADQGSAASSDEAIKSLKRVIVANQLAITQLLRLVDSEQKSGQAPNLGATATASLAHHAHLASVQVHVPNPAPTTDAAPQEAAGRA